jgi:uncharacterized protein YkwD
MRDYVLASIRTNYSKHLCRNIRQGGPQKSFKFTFMKKFVLILLLAPFFFQAQALIENNRLNQDFVIILNTYRKQNGLEPVFLDEPTIYRAKLQAQYCSKIKELTHDCPNWFPKRWAECALWSWQELNAQLYLEQWQDSPPHNELLLLDGATKIGIYYSFGIWDGREGNYAVLVIN